MDSNLMNSGTEKKGISGSTIKIIAIVAMLIDHVAAAWITRILMVGGMADLNGQDLEASRSFMANYGGLYALMMVMRLIGRLGFPIFCFLLVEGFGKTRNRAKYAMRLGIFALISEVPFDLALTGSFWHLGYQNVYFTLLIGMLLLCSLDYLSKVEIQKKALQVAVIIGGIAAISVYVGIMLANLIGTTLLALPIDMDLNVAVKVICVIMIVISALIMWGVWAGVKKSKGAEAACRVCSYALALAAGMFLADILNTDYSGMGVLTIAVMYWFRKSRMMSFAMGCIVLTAMSTIEATAFFALIPISKYNGKRGLKMKYFFYAFYPGHLLLIWLLCYAMGMGWIPAV